MKINTDTKKDNACDLKAMIDELIRKEQAYQSEISILKEQVKYLQSQLYGRKADKAPVDPLLIQLSLFNADENSFPIAESMEEDAENTVEVPAHTRKKGGRKPIPDHLPVITKVHDIDEADKWCECGHLKERIGEERSKQLDIIPAQIQVIEHVRPKYACKHCEGVDGKGPTVAIAPMPEQIIPKCIGTPGLIAYILVAKFVDALPFYRQEKQLLRIGVEISRATMCSWAQKVADSFEILLMMLKREILSGPLINIDETPTQVFNEIGRRNETKSYMWVFRGGTPEQPGIIFEYRPTRQGDVAAAFLKDYHGVVQTDGYSGYNFIDSLDGISHMGCWAHVRRKFMDVVKATGKPEPGNKQKKGNAEKALEYIRKLYQIEKEAKVNDISGDALLFHRQENAQPVVNEFKEWLDSVIGEIPPKSLLGKAVNYTLKQWHRLVVYLGNAHVTPDNNMAENTIRPFVVGRKNWLFSASPEGATASAAIYSIIETAKANGLEPYWYFRYIIEAIPEAMTEQDFKSLLPMYVDRSLLDGPKTIS